MDIQETTLPTNVKAFLKVLQKSEGTDQYKNPYTTLYGGSQFTSYAGHPRKIITAGGYSSSAAGAYQILAKTYDSLGMKDFSPRSQDLAAVALIKRRGAYADVVAGNFDVAIQKCNKEWASLPGSPYGQPTVKLSVLKAYFIKVAGTINKASPLIFFVCGAVFLWSVLKTKMYV